MRQFCVITGLAVGLLVCPMIAGAEMIGGQNWADSVVSYTSKIQNYNGDLMDSTTTWWVTGKSDADVDPVGGNGYAWDAGDQDYVAGWRTGKHHDQEIVVKFDTALKDLVDGNDLVIHMYCGPKANASVWGSSDSGATYTQLGSIIGHAGEIPGTAGYFYDAEFEFPDVLGDVDYVKVHREVCVAQSGMFFDSFASVPEPTTLALLVLGSLLMAARWIVIRLGRPNGIA